MNSTAYAPARPVVAVPARPAAPSRRSLPGDHPLAQLARFALVGGASNLAYLLCFLACAGCGSLAANVAGSIVSTAIANELHRRLTFRAAGRVGWCTAQWEGGGLALAGLLVSTAALAGLTAVAPGLGEPARAGAVLVVTALVGGARFLALRARFSITGGYLTEAGDGWVRTRKQS
ncbi:GtrA family protein [Nocardia thailandica]